MNGRDRLWKIEKDYGILLGTYDFRSQIRDMNDLRRYYESMKKYRGKGQPSAVTEILDATHTEKVRNEIVNDADKLKQIADMIASLIRYADDEGYEFAFKPAEVGDVPAEVGDVTVKKIGRTKIYVTNYPEIAARQQKQKQENIPQNWHRTNSAINSSTTTTRCREKIWSRCRAYIE
ncbi:MAG: hypothetical protein FWC53_04020 [Firmicutes bacterium]|nr:hypothetical protein [Bacillota bacterium]